MKKIWFVFILFITGLTTDAQSVYLLKYNLENQNTNTAHSAFFVRNDDGTGIIRIKYLSPADGKTVLAEMQAEEEHPEMKEGVSTTEKVIYKLSNPRIISGNKENIQPFTILFKKDPAGEFEPWGITAPDDTGKILNRFPLLPF